MINAILINPFNRTIIPVQYRDWQEISPLIGGRTFTVAPFSDIDTEPCLYVDDEGMLAKFNVSFTIDGNTNPLFGKGLIVGTDEEGETVDCPFSLEEVKVMVSFEDQFFVFHNNPPTLVRCSQFPITVDYHTEESGWHTYSRTNTLEDAYKAWDSLEDSGIEFDSLRITKS